MSSALPAKPTLVPAPASDKPADAAVAPVQAATEAKVPAPETKAAAPAKPAGFRRYIIAAALILAVAAVARYATVYISTGWYHIATDDAYVKADITSIAAKVGGFIKALPVAENASVTADTVVAEIDDGDYVLALQSAKAKADTQRSTISRFDSQLAQADAGIAQANAAIAQARAQVGSSQSDVKRTEADYVRYAQLTKDKVTTPQKLEQIVSDRDKAKAALASTKAAVDNAQALVGNATAAKAVLAAQQQEAAHVLDELLVQVSKAERDLSFTKVRAGVGGVLGNRGAQVGNYVQPGARLGALIADGSLYIEANFKETQLKGLKPGQPVTVDVDALGGSDLHGTIESFAPGSGSIFSLLPPENATGNFTKIVQRVPVRIALPADARTVDVLRPGMSVTVTVDTKPQASGGASVAAK